jgi:hypothetical protein
LVRLLPQGLRVGRFCKGMFCLCAEPRHCLEALR